MLLAAAGLVGALGLAGSGVWSRRATLDRLQARADDAAVPRVQAISPKTAPPTQSLTLPGQIAAWNEAQIFGQVSGYVQSWTKDYGAHVQAGDVLATIDTPTLDAQYRASEAKLKVAQAQYNISALTAQRFTQLTESNSVAQQTIDDKNAQAEASKAEVAAAQQDVNNFKARLAFKELRSPFAGIVLARRINIGDFIDGGGGESTPMKQGLPPFTVADVHKLRVFVSVPQTLGAILKPGITAEVRLPGKPGRSIPATFLTQAGGVMTSTRTIVTEFEIDHPDDTLMPGAFVETTMTYPSDPTILTVPSQALLFRAAGMQVALIGQDARIHLQNVTLGRNLGLTVEITSGLKASDRIVANPSLGLLDGQQVKEVQAAQGY